MESYRARCGTSPTGHCERCSPVRRGEGCKKHCGTRIASGRCRIWSPAGAVRNADPIGALRTCSSAERGCVKRRRERVSAALCCRAAAVCAPSGHCRANPHSCAYLRSALCAAELTVPAGGDRGTARGSGSDPTAPRRAAPVPAVRDWVPARGRRSAAGGTGPRLYCGRSGETGERHFPLAAPPPALPHGPPREG